MSERPFLERFPEPSAHVLHAYDDLQGSYYTAVCRDCGSKLATLEEYEARGRTH